MKEETTLEEAEKEFEKLISMTDFVLESMQNQRHRRDKYDDICEYAEFLKQPLELWMFVPCDKKGNVLEEPNYPFRSNSNDLELMKEWEQAKERCLFEGFEHLGEGTVAYKGVYIEKDSFDKINIEGLQYYCSSTEIKLTPTAIKQLKL